MTGWRTSLVGRQRELAELGDALDDAFTGRGRVLVLTGEPGIGKTRLADELTTLAAQRGALTLWGRCWEGGSLPPYWPWLQILGRLTGTAATAADLASVVPDLPPGAADESDHARFLVFDGVARLLREHSEKAPLVLVVDDLHAADAPSRLLLEFVARLVRDMQVLVVATSHTAHGLPAGSDVIDVRGLDAAGTGALLDAVAGASVAGSTAATIHDVTGGNPFFVRELARLVADDPAAVAGKLTLVVPDTVREVVRRRLTPLSASARDVLDLAAVHGRDFDANLLGVDGAAAALNEAETAGIVGREAGVTRYAFTHPILRETIYADLATDVRQALHLRVANALAAAERGDTHVAALAHHFVAAAPLADPDQVQAYVLRAGRHALAAHAYEDAVAHFTAARQLLRAHHAEDEDAACRLALELGQALAAAGDEVAAQRTYDEAVELARRVGSPDELALAVLGRAGDIPAAGVVDEHTVALLEEARRALGESHPALAARLAARLAIELYFTHELSRRDELSRGALEQAEATGDAAAIAAALYARHYALFGPHDLDGRLATATALLELATTSGDLEWALQAHWWRVSDLLEQGDIIEVDRELAVWSRLAAELRQPKHLWAPAMVRAARANLAGRIDQCEQLAYEAQAIGQAAVPENAMAYFSAQFFSVRRWQGRLAELQPVIESLVETMPQVPLWRCALAYLFSELERDIEARRELDFFADRDFVDIPRDAGWLMSISLLADVSGYLGDAAPARVLHDLMAPYRERLIVAGFGGVSHASAARCLGVTAATMGDFDRSADYFATAIAANRRAGAAAWLAHTRMDHADMLVARGAPGDDAAAVESLEDALVEFRQLGLDAFVDRVTRRLDAIDLPVDVALEVDVAAAGGTNRPMADVIRLSPTGRRPRNGALPASPPATASPGVPSATGRTGTFVRHGDYWAIGFGTESFQLRDARGLHYLAALLAQPDRDVAVVDLAGAVDATGARVPGRDAGEVLDATARAAYRRRLADLEEERDEAHRFNDGERAARADAEIDFLQRELAAAVGLGGRARRTVSSAERARVRVTKAIKTAIKRLGTESQPLGYHLSGAVHTGYVCAYRPDPADPVAWEL